MPLIPVNPLSPKLSCKLKVQIKSVLDGDHDSLEERINSLDRDSQLKLKAQIKALLEGRLKPSNSNPFRTDFDGFALREPEPEPLQEPVDTRTPIEKIRERNRYIKT